MNLTIRAYARLKNVNESSIRKAIADLRKKYLALPEEGWAFFIKPQKSAP